ncbi:hypothetical protein D3C71_2124430 [compost metagenome]
MRQRPKHFRCADLAQRRLHPFPGDGRIVQGNIGRNRPREQERILQHDAHMLTKLLLR